MKVSIISLLSTIQKLICAQVFCEADADTCLSRRILRDVECRGRSVEGVIKQWFMWVKPNFEKVCRAAHLLKSLDDMLTTLAVRRSTKKEWRSVPNHHIEMKCKLSCSRCNRA